MTNTATELIRLKAEVAFWAFFVLMFLVEPTWLRFVFGGLCVYKAWRDWKMFSGTK